MTTKKKLIISITTLSIAIVAALGITFGVLAATQQNVANQFSVTYVANNVSATVAAKYQIANSDPVYFTGGTVAWDDSTNPATGANAGTTFAAADNQASRSLTSSLATLTANNNYVIYTYRFHNDNAANGRAMTVTLTDSTNKEGKNVNVYYYTAATDGASLATIKGNNNSNTSVPAAQTVAAQGTVYFFIAVEIADDTLDVDNYTSTAQAGITWTLAQVEPVAPQQGE